MSKGTVIKDTTDAMHVHNIMIIYYFMPTENITSSQSSIALVLHGMNGILALMSCDISLYV